MKAIGNAWAIFQREMASFFLSPIAYVAICLFLLVNGWIFYQRAVSFSDDPQQLNAILGALFGGAPFWCLFLCPVITMRLIAEEKRAGTLETLMTTPVTPFQVVAGKFLAAEVTFVLIWSGLFLHVLILSVLGNPDPGPILAVSLGLLTLSALMNGLGLLASALTRNQIVAVTIAFAGNLLLMTVGMARLLFPEEAEAEQFFDLISIQSRFVNEYGRGVVDLRFIVLDILGAGGFLAFAVRALEARAWK